jgi:hypothetical protein
MDHEPKVSVRERNDRLAEIRTQKIGIRAAHECRADYKIQIKAKVSLLGQSAGSRRSDHAFLRALAVQIQ